MLFLAVDPGKVFLLAEKALAKNVKVIDFGADIRFRDSKVWEQWYNVSATILDVQRCGLFYSGNLA